MTQNETPLETLQRISAETGIPLTTVEPEPAADRPRRSLRRLLKINGKSYGRA